MDLECITVGLISLLAAISPGPDFILVLQNSLMGSRKVGIYTAIGVAAGLSVHCFYTVIGFAVVIQESQWIYSLIKYLGAVYLAYIGFKLLLSMKSKPATCPGGMNFSEKETVSTSQAFTRGFLCNVLNPKASLFVLSLFSQVVSFSTSWIKQMVFIMEMVSITCVWFVFIAILLTHHTIYQKFSDCERYVNAIMGFLLIGFSIKIALF